MRSNYGTLPYTMTGVVPFAPSLEECKSMLEKEADRQDLQVCGRIVVEVQRHLFDDESTITIKGRLGPKEAPND